MKKIAIKAIMIAISIGANFGFAQIQNGVYQDNSGSVNIKNSNIAGQQNFVIDTVGANGHMCYAEGIIKKDKGYVDNDDSEEQCILDFKSKQNVLSIEIGEKYQEACSAYCGARAYLGGNFRMPPKFCSTQNIIRERNLFKKYYDQKMLDQAEITLNKLLTQCDFYLDFTTKDSIRNDLALTLYHQNKHDLCLEILSNTIALARDEFQSLPPVDEISYEKINKAILFNAQLCLKNSN